MSSFLLKCNQLLRQFDYTLSVLLRQRFPPGSLGILPVVEPNTISPPENKLSLKQLLGDGIFWAVPRNRRTIEKRWKRKYGFKEYIWKLLEPKTNLRVCTSCGHHHELGVLCPHCYDKVKQETQAMQNKIQEELGLNPVEQDVIVLYDGERNEHPAEFWQGKRIIEMNKPRPIWFSKNLTQKTTQPLATTKEVKPNDLG